MGEKDTIFSASALHGSEMAYQKVNADQRQQLHSQVLENDDLQATILDLEWDMEKELEEPGFEKFQVDNVDPHHLGNSENASISVTPIQLSMSPHGRFERLQEDPDYVTHYTRQAPKINQYNCCKLMKFLCTAILVFILGILIGYYAKKSCSTDRITTNQTIPGPSLSPSETNVYQETLQNVKAKNIKMLLRNLTQFAKDEKEELALAKSLLDKWISLGLTEAHLINYTVLLSLPSTSPNTVTVADTGQCFYPNGQRCETLTKVPYSNDLLYSYAAYSSKGTLEGEIVDVQYGAVEDLIKANSTTNATYKIALLKLGHTPLLYKLSLLTEVGFSGALLYVDPCDLPKDTHVNDKAFGISLNPGGDPSTPGYSSIDGSFRQNQSTLTPLLVQPVSALLAKELLSSSEVTSAGECVPFAKPSTVSRIIKLYIRSVAKYKTIYNVVGYIKSSTNTDRYVIVGSHHDSWYGNSGDWASSAVITAATIQALMSQVRKGWRPDRTIVFCSWGGTAFGNIGSYEWAENFKDVLQKNAVAYVSVHSPIIGNGTLQLVASPVLQQLATEVRNKRLSLNCTRRENCSGPNVSSAQMHGDADFFINSLGVPTVQTVYQDVKTAKSPSFLSEALFPADSTVIEDLDPSFSLHETVTKLIVEVILRLASEPVLPFNTLDLALEIQNRLKGDTAVTDQLLAQASVLRENAQLFQSDEMRPAYDPKERDLVRVRMLNDVLQNLEKSFIVQHTPPGIYNVSFRGNGSRHK
ncbi:inactive N-acetylated-alpha-linked acidic dipeptidase-like protein 2 isoform X1 [Latimeria chalumnae]|uniref:inactive N-acetylated-alpha-linked acidic dipeptidase-like protein 2 isoform X1 n=1 Tax=Latimeria chalumnae TaxID=7897 RepID=UPI00313D3A13